MKKILVTIPVKEKHRAYLRGESLKNEVDFETGYRKFVK